jgi:hypothetical protein
MSRRSELRLALMAAAACACLGAPSPWPVALGSSGSGVTPPLRGAARHAALVRNEHRERFLVTARRDNAAAAAGTALGTSWARETAAAGAAKEAATGEAAEMVPETVELAMMRTKSHERLSLATALNNWGAAAEAAEAAETAATAAEATGATSVVPQRVEPATMRARNHEHFLATTRNNLGAAAAAAVTAGTAAAEGAAAELAAAETLHAASASAALKVGHHSYRSPGQRMPLQSSEDASKCVSMMPGGV